MAPIKDEYTSPKMPEGADWELVQPKSLVVVPCNALHSHLIQDPSSQLSG